MNKEQEKALLDLADRLETEKPELDMSTWKCGTAACAIGWFCTWNPQDELILIENPNLNTAFRIIPVLRGWLSRNIIDREMLHIHTNSAIEERFDLCEDFVDCFLPETYTYEDPEFDSEELNPPVTVDQIPDLHERVAAKIRESVRLQKEYEADFEQEKLEYLVELEEENL